jgi:hypothetical protein
VNGPQPSKWSTIQVLEAAAAILLASAVVATTGGVGWLVVQLPSRLEQIEAQIKQIIGNQTRVDQNLKILEDRVVDHDRRIIRLEVGR